MNQRLGNTTEKPVMAAIEALRPEYTMISIAHRLSTVRHCDTIVKMDGARVLAQGAYAQLIQRSPTSQEMAAAAGPA